MTTPTQLKAVPISRDTNLLDLGIEPGWFVRFGGCSIWLEIDAVWADMVSCAARDPKQRTVVLATVGDYYSAIDHVCQEMPTTERWIKLDRTKSFYDKFYPERDKILAGAYVPTGPHVRQVK